MNGNYTREYKLICSDQNPKTWSIWELQDNETDLSSANCIPSHSCKMSNIEYDDSVTVQSFEDHLGFPLNVFDDVKISDVIIAWCSEIGKNKDTSYEFN